MEPVPHSPDDSIDAASSTPRRRFRRSSASAIAAVSAVAGLAATGALVGSNIASASDDGSEPAVAEAATDADLDALFAPYDECLEAQLPGVFDFDDAGIEAIEMSDSVSLFTTKDGGEFSVFDFGDGDGEITITKRGDDVTVSIDGDVQRFDETDMVDMIDMVDVPTDDMGDLELTDGDIVASPELDAEFEAAHDECAELLPDDVVFEKVAGAVEEVPTDG